MSLRATGHLLSKRWPQRGDPAQHPQAAWTRGEVLDMHHAEDGVARVPDHDEARYDAETQTVIFRREDRLVTCYSVCEAMVTNDHGRAAREAVEAQFGRIDDRPTVCRDTES